jgi:hypothetical protein
MLARTRHGTETKKNQEKAKKGHSATKTNKNRKKQPKGFLFIQAYVFSN